MRIIAGKFRGRRLFAPRGLEVRPTADRVKEAVFSILGPRVTGAAVLDLFAGTGNLGLEALSRGADRAVFVDHLPKALAALERNLKALGLGDRARIVRADLAKGPGPWKDLGPFDLIFLDPPYGQGLVARALGLVLRAGAAAPDALAVAEHAAGEKDQINPPGWSIVQSRAYGHTMVTFLSNAH
ncbi:MAG: 16S rRNA (guanine(966)-N(2))-methyltransferase RsmD [Thermodesulfobacteriota bacterium]